MEVPYLYVSIILLIVSYFFTSHFIRKFSNLPPTVFPALPIIGHLYLLKAPVYRTFAKISAKYGPILYLRLGSRRLLLVSSPSAAEECFTKNDIAFANRPHLLFGKIIGENYTSFNWADYGDNWRKLRRLASTEVLSMHRINDFHDARADEGKLLVRKLLSHSSTPLNMKSVLYEMTLNVMMRMITGKRYFGSDMPEVEEEGKRFREIMTEGFLLASATNAGDYLPALSWFGGKGLEKRLLAFREKRARFFQGILDQHRKSKGGEGENKKKTMIEVLLSLQRSDPEYYTDVMIRNFVMVLLSGGTDTSSSTMEWAMTLLVNNPQVLKKAQHEIDTVIGKDRLVDESDFSNLPYLRCIINETQRMKPGAPLLVPHESSEECTVGGYKIPRGTILIVNQWAIHHDPKIWANPETFKPERFEGVEGARDGFKFLPFGFGRRICPGEGLALRVIGITLGLLIQCFEWERMNEEMVDMTEGPGITMPKAEPLVAKCKPRLEMQNLLSHL